MEHRVAIHSERQKRVKLEFEHKLATVLGKRMNDTKSCIVCLINQRKTHSKCSKKRPHVSLHSSHWRRNDWCTLSKISGTVLILSAVTTILATRSSTESTGVSHIKDFMCPQKKKSSGLRSGERGGQATGPPRSTHRADMYAYAVATRPSCLGDMLRRQAGTKRRQRR
ncbi:hypothetical protein AVEN_209823-1 [Araneus ventricosus]|uniref:Uncharacterized protein n=1 Tax=Araneus ventricosus TaxID=182803 RepID=A0A4Y2WYE4_ARAVE|nr:hypothetical protein AVEN_139394-1 [Araneus ventricosus]GBO42426.1 hypothetical protein AVEN_209823-1 [Araneus ventricosus]